MAVPETTESYHTVYMLANHFQIIFCIVFFNSLCKVTNNVQCICSTLDLISQNRASCFLSLEVFLPRGELGLALVGRLRMLESAQSNFEFLSERLVRNLLIFHLIFQADCFVLDLEVLISIVFTLFSFDVLDNLLL